MPDMKPALYGRIFFGASAVLFGVIALMWHDADTWQALRAIWRLPFGGLAGGCLMAAQIAGGIGIVSPRTARPASVVLVIVYLLFSLVCLPAIFAAPATYESYPGFFEQLSLLCGALALYIATGASRARSAALGRLARLGFAICTVSFALTQIFYFSPTVGMVPKWIPPSQKFWAILTTAAFALAAIAILINRRTRLALCLLTFMLALFAVLVWVPRLAAHPHAHFSWSEFALTLLITGAAWMVAGLKRA